MYLTKSFDEVKKYVGTAEVHFIVNVKKFNNEKYGPQTIEKYSKII